MFWICIEKQMSLIQMCNSVVFPGEFVRVAMIYDNGRVKNSIARLKYCLHGSLKGDFVID